MSPPAPLVTFPAAPAAPAERPRRRPWVGTVGRVLGAPLAVIGAMAAGIGWLYLLRHTGIVRMGPILHDALPLQRLAGDSGQPLLRVCAAWLPAGLLAGLALRAMGVRRPAVRAAVASISGLIVLLAAGAAADAVTASEPLRSHVLAQPGRAATWIAAGLMALGATLPPRTRP